MRSLTVKWRVAFLAAVFATYCLPSDLEIAAAQRASTYDRLCPPPLDFALLPDGFGTSAHGIHRDVVRPLEVETGRRIRMAEMPSTRALEEFKAGRIQLSGRFFETPERQACLWLAHFQRTKTYDSEIAKLRTRDPSRIVEFRGRETPFDAFVMDG